MAANVKVIRHADLVRASPDGRASLASGGRLLAAIAALAQQLETFEILVDLRHVSGQLRFEEQWELAASLVRYRRTFLRKTAVLCQPDRFESARSFALLAASHGFVRIKAFVEYEAAMDWLVAAPQGDTVP